jgi:hypothetical protein
MKGMVRLIRRKKNTFAFTIENKTRQRIGSLEFSDIRGTLPDGTFTCQLRLIREREGSSGQRDSRTLIFEEGTNSGDVHFTTVPYAPVLGSIAFHFRSLTVERGLMFKTCQY